MLLLQLSPTAGSDAAEAAPHALQPPVRALAPLLPPEGQDVRDLNRKILTASCSETLDAGTRRDISTSEFHRCVKFVPQSEAKVTTWSEAGSCNH